MYVLIISYLIPVIISVIILKLKELYDFAIGKTMRFYILICHCNYLFSISRKRKKNEAKF